jgi:hypothetical protein
MLPGLGRFSDQSIEPEAMTALADPDVKLIPTSSCKLWITSGDRPAVCLSRE